MIDKDRPFVCKVCQIIFQSRAAKPLYCSGCRGSGKARWAKLSLDYKHRLKNIYSGALARARSKNIPFTITRRYLEKLWEDQEGCCSITNIPFILARCEEYHVHPHAPTLDRIIPKFGYVQGNVRLITHHLNMAINEYGLERFEQLIREYTN